MKFRLISLLSILVFILAACKPATPSPTPTAIPTPTATLPAPQVGITSAPDATKAAADFLDAWKAENYEKMYGMLSRLSGEANTSESFMQLYKETASNMTLQSLETEILSTLTNPHQAQVAFRVIFHTTLIGDIARDMVMNLSLENGAWRVGWVDSLILPELAGGNHLLMEVKNPARGAIKDKNGVVIVDTTEAVALGVQPGKIDKEAQLLIELSRLTGRSTDDIKAAYEGQGDDWYIAIGDAPASAVDERMSILSGLGGLIMNRYTTRYYFNGGAAAQTIGYAMAIPAEKVDEYKRLGYSGDEKVGIAGLEQVFEADLMGERGAVLYVIDKEGQIVTRLAQKEMSPAKSIQTTIDIELQKEVQKAIEGFSGAVVILERDTGRILAISSSPTFNPNLFDYKNTNTGYMLGPMLSDGMNRLLSRAAQSGYPLGSVFKIITMSAALESGLYTKDTKYTCGYEFTELPGQIFYDWTFKKGYNASGELTLPEGLMRSCNPFFYHIGLDLYRQNLPRAVSDMARAFGLGKATGTDGIEETNGNIQDPATDGDAVQMAIGQGTVLVSPLQVAQFIAALGGDGTIYQPQLIEQIVGIDGVPTFSFTPKAKGTLPLKPENFQIVRDAMFTVVNDKRGTAFRRFLGININIYGKTGTAQNPNGNDHAWFAGFTNEKDPKKPDLAIVVLAENSGEGSDIAAPIFRRIIEIYFYGKPLNLYPWEARLNITKTPTSQYTNTPVPTNTSEPTQEVAPTETETPVP